VYKETFLAQKKVQVSPVSDHGPNGGPSSSGTLVMRTDTQVGPIAVDFAQMSEEYSPRHPFAGRIVVRDHELSDTTTLEDVTAAGFRPSTSNVYSLTIGKIELHVELESTGIPQTVASVRILTKGLPDTPPATTTTKPAATPTPKPTSTTSRIRCLSWSYDSWWEQISSDTARVHVQVAVNSDCAGPVAEVMCYATLNAGAGRVYDQGKSRVRGIAPHGRREWSFVFTCPMYVTTLVSVDVYVANSLLGRSVSNSFRTQ